MAQLSSAAVPSSDAESLLGAVPSCEETITTARQKAVAATQQTLVHLLLCTNALFLQHAAVCLASMLTNNSGLFFDIVIVGRSTERLDQHRLRRSLTRFSNYSLSFHEFTPPIGRLLPLNPRAHYTLDNWTRLWVSDFFPADLDRVMYVDCDIVVVGDIEELWHTDLGGALLGAVDIPGSDRGVTHLGLSAADGYFNSGVLLFDLKQWRETRALERLLAYVEACPELMMRDVDQEALNACFHAHRKRLDYKWNVTSSFFESPQPFPFSVVDVEAVHRDARLIHFNGALKPWSYFCNHPRKAEYEKYLQMTEWRDFVPPDRTIANRLRKSISPLLPDKAKAVLKRLRPLFSENG